ncbi:pentatricopeptide repeat-containing protein At2g35030, mitochondrial-like [Selaginella moellendorffii]|uniref:pentatricopeptide repeat-containing protein At2g35030, mitochondrial-like n=1 Tax=Selaginella moellendorffii TaxID=88036 RepID=UPI000D1C4530|nr:pentatricopeptide repeat-containing protein At2g35030, mitochondrial-like [Selaginella moellendorffii]|eukprot:XP_024536208.1 pentatricopeptide repeat-containing protein At2g35030, mitochondrial-like [Selaginella moellendorffii]
MDKARSCKSLPMAQEIHKRIQANPPLHESLFVYCLTSLAVSGQVSNAKAIFDSMPEKNLTSWNAMMAAYAKNGYMDEAELLFQEMPFHDAVSCNTLIAAHSQRGNLDTAKEIFDDMLFKTLPCWNAMLSAYATGWHLVQARQTFHSMPARNLISWTLFLNALIMEDDLQMTRSVLAKCPAGICLPRDLVAYTVMESAYAQKGELERAEAIFNSMPQRDLVAWNAMIRGLLPTRLSRASKVSL